MEKSGASAAPPVPGLGSGREASAEMKCARPWMLLFKADFWAVQRSARLSSSLLYTPFTCRGFRAQASGGFGFASQHRSKAGGVGLSVLRYSIYGLHSQPPDVLNSVCRHTEALQVHLSGCRDHISNSNGSHLFAQVQLWPVISLREQSSYICYLFRTMTDKKGHVPRTPAVQFPAAG